MPAFTNFYTDDDSIEEFIALADFDDFNAFWAANEEAMIEDGIDREHALALTMNCNLVFGGGAAPRIRVGFVD